MNRRSLFGLFAGAAAAAVVPVAALAECKPKVVYKPLTKAAVDRNLEKMYRLGVGYQMGRKKMLEVLSVAGYNPFAELDEIVRYMYDTKDAQFVEWFATPVGFLTRFMAQVHNGPMSLEVTNFQGQVRPSYRGIPLLRTYLDFDRLPMRNV